MEVSDWKESVTYNELEVNHFYEAVNLAKAGNLSSLTIIGTIGHDRATVTLNDTWYTTKIKVLYEEFSLAHDPSILQGVAPLDIIGVYYYANNEGDPTTMWHLLNVEKLSITLDDFVEYWENEGPSLLRAEYIHAEPDRSDHSIISPITIVFEFQDGNSSTSYYVTTMNYDLEESIWKIEVIPSNYDLDFNLD